MRADWEQDRLMRHYLPAFRFAAAVLLLAASSARTGLAAPTGSQERTPPPAPSKPAAPATAPAAASGVIVLPHDQVKAAFAVGKTLLETPAFKIIASRREGPGQAEVHALDTDIFYILEGTATLVTGGNTLQPKTTEPNEVRGDGIQGGQARAVTQGDVIVIPKGIPHWFKSVTAPFTYYVVKVR
jgi:mannose-6-phosphate isomerase-like protein (cupin superfamily)